jgi:hypothetical protein
MLRSKAAFVFCTLLACTPKDQSTPPPDATPVATSTSAPTPTTATPTPELSTDALRAHLEFLADDAQQGRPPGTDADERVQTYVESAMKKAGLQPAFASSYRQPFTITDGVQLKSGQTSTLDVGGKPIAHAPVPFSASTSAPVTGKLVFVGHGIPKGGKDTGDYAGLGKKVQGAIVVALVGAPDDPHIGQAERRAQSKAIAARDHGAVGFVLWDPQATTPFPNHGEAADLGIAAAFVGKDGSAALVKAIAGKKGDDPTKAGIKPGRASAKQAALQMPVERVELRTANVAARLVGSRESDRVIVVGAHMDHLGFGTDASLAPGSQEIHNGADDNASGVAVMLETCSALAAIDAKKRPFDVVCIAFGAEEMGLLGSKHYVKSLGDGERKQIAAMLNFDMVGRLGADGLVVAGAGTSKAWAGLLDAHRGELVVKPTDDGYGPSDHGSFYEVGIPVLHFFTGPHEDYHRPTDDLEKINVEGAAQVGALAFAIASELEAEKIVPDYVETSRPQNRGGGFRVSLGTIPDYGAKVDGVRLSGVRKGGAAETAGMRKGDVIKKIGAREIHNLDDYMAAFAEMKPNEKIVVVIERDGKSLDLAMTPQAPKSQ